MFNDRITRVAFIVFGLAFVFFVLIGHPHAEQRTAYPPANAKTSAGPIYQGTAYPPGMGGGGGGGLAIELVIGVNSLPLVS